MPKPMAPAVASARPTNNMSGSSRHDRSRSDSMPGFLSGLVPACHTPFDRDGRLDLVTVERQAAFFRESGLRSVFVAGTTGECASLSLDERKGLCEHWVEVAGDSLRIAVHTGSNCQVDAMALAAHARRAGAAAVAVMAPHYFKPASVHD